MARELVGGSAGDTLPWDCPWGAGDHEPQLCERCPRRAATSVSLTRVSGCLFLRKGEISVHFSFSEDF